MKVALLCNFPLYDYAAELGIKTDLIKRYTSWNVNLVKGLRELETLELLVITSDPLLARTQVIEDDHFTIYFIHPPRRANLLTGFQWLRFKALKILQDFKPDIVHGIGTEHIYPYIAVHSSYPHVVTVHGIMNEIVRKSKLPIISKKRLFALLERYVFKQSQHLISISPYVEYVVKNFTKAKIYSVENPVAEGFFKEKADPGASKTILFVGDIQQRKDLLTLLDAFSIVRNHNNIHDDLRLSIVGSVVEPGYFEQVQSRIGEDHIQKNIQFHGFVSPGRLPEVYAHAAFLMLSSIEETAPMCIAEAMSCGLPVVATDVGGVRHMVRDGVTGFVIPVRDPTALAEAANQLLRDKALRKRMGNAAKVEAKNRFHPRTVAEKTLNVYRAILGDR